MGAAGERDLDAVVRQPLGVEPGGAAGAVQQVDGALLEHAGADPAEDVVAADAVEDHRLDPGVVQQLAEQQAGRPRADDRHLRPHALLPVPAILRPGRRR